MEIKEGFLLRPKTTMRIGGSAKAFAELKTKEDAEAAYRYSVENKRKLLPLGSGSNTIFSDGEIDALVVQIKHEAVTIDKNRITVGAGKNLAMLINELGAKGLNLSDLTGIPGTIGGAIFGNAGQGPKGVWIDAFIESVTIYDGKWRSLSKKECEFSYRESNFKYSKTPIIIWEAVLNVPSGDPVAIKSNIEALLKKRIETQPHLKTAGSCFKAIGGTPAWQLIDQAGLRGFKTGGIEISPKHANFLINTGEGTYADAVSVVEEVKKKIPEHLEVEMRFVEPDGSLKY
jgi:UDP-N-acetylmuramate dehydrogenase